LADVTAEDWSRVYSRATGLMPGGAGADKYVPPVNRIDNAYGDRNLVCSCPPIDDYKEAAE
jgi:glycine dehydrogenase